MCVRRLWVLTHYLPDGAWMSLMRGRQEQDSRVIRVDSVSELNRVFSGFSK